METVTIFVCVLMLFLLFIMFKYTVEGMLPGTPSELPRVIVGGSTNMYEPRALPGGVSRTLVFHFAPWCGACTRFRPVWDEMKTRANIRGLSFVENNETVSPTPSVTKYPTITIADEWGNRHRYEGARTSADILAWATAPTIVG